MSGRSFEVHLLSRTKRFTRARLVPNNHSDFKLMRRMIMKTMSTAMKAITCALFIMTLSIVAQAQTTRTWVSGVGDDLNPCSRTAPCKTYAGAITKTARDGEISTLDPGGFGTVTINKSITINGGGTGQGYGSINASATT